MGDELYANSTDAVFIINNDGIIVNLNQAARKMFNLKGKIINYNIKKLFKKNFVLNKHSDIEIKIINNKYISMSQTTIYQGALSIGKILTIRDITIRKKAEKDLIKTTKELSTAQEGAGVGSFTYDVKNDVVIWSDKLYQLSELLIESVTTIFFIFDFLIFSTAFPLKTP